MITPIVVYEPRDLRVYETIDEAELAIEAIDAMNGDIYVFDAEGRILNVAVKNEHSRVRLIASPSAPCCPEWLRGIVTEYLLALGYPGETVKGVSLKDLLEVAGFPRRPSTPDS